MGPANQAMWAAYSINASRFSKIINHCVHPCDNSRKLYFYADSPHAFKNAKSGFLTVSEITLPNDFVVYYCLPSSTVKKDYLYELINEDKNLELKLAPKLTEECVNTKNHFQKMKVGNAKRVFSQDVASSIEYLANDSNDDRITTARFVDFIARWFNIMCSRNISAALSYKDPQKYEETISFLEESILLFTNMRVGPKGAWKPYQTAMIIATQTVLDLSKYLLDRDFTFFFPSRLTQDCLENLFSIVRMKNVIPHAVQFKNNLKLICISQYMKVVSNSNYDEDDREFLSEFFDILLKNRSSKSHFLPDTSQSTIVNAEEKVDIGKTELNVLYCIAGYILSNIKKNKKYVMFALMRLS